MKNIANILLMRRIKKFLVNPVIVLLHVALLIHMLWILRGAGSWSVGEVLTQFILVGIEGAFLIVTTAKIEHFFSEHFQ